MLILLSFLDVLLAIASNSFFRDSVRTDSYGEVYMPGALNRNIHMLLEKLPSNSSFHPAPREKLKYELRHVKLPAIANEENAKSSKSIFIGA